MTAGVAQLVEQLTCNQQVAGSSPIASSIFFSLFLVLYGGVPEWLKGADCKSVGSAYDGSNPSPSTIFVTGVRFGYAGVAQLARALAFQAKGRGFESRFPLHTSACNLAQVAQG